MYSAPGSLNLSILQFLPLTPTSSLRIGQRFAVADDNASKAVGAAAMGNSEEEAASAKSREEYLNQVLLKEDTAMSLCRGV